MNIERDTTPVWTIRTLVTKDVILPEEDGTYELNKYGTYIQLIGEAILRSPVDKSEELTIIRFEGPLSNGNISTRDFDKFEEKIKQLLKSGSYLKRNKIEL